MSAPLTQLEEVIEIMGSGRITLARKRMTQILPELVDPENIAWIHEVFEILASGRVALAREHLKNLVAYANLPPPRFPTDPHFTPRSSHVRPPHNAA